MSPKHLRKGDRIVTKRRNGVPVEFIRVKDVETCTRPESGVLPKGVGHTHVNEKLCFDNAADLDIIRNEN